MDDFNSEIPGPSSCSNPSEPPDIRNWFSSYKYESFVLDTCENFGGISSDETESDKYESAIGKEENFDGSEEIRNVDEAENFNSKEDSLHSLSVLSEPSDIRKWYSSYVYESPSFDTNDGFNSYVSRETEREKDKPVNEERIKDEFANLDQFQQDASDKICSTKLVKCNSSLVDRKDEPHPLFSEPLDIGNWFPDYVYESPVLDTSDEFRNTLCKDTESRQNKFSVEDSMGQKQDDLKTKAKTRRRGEVVTGNTCLSGLGECTRNSPLRHDEQENRSISKDLHWGGVKENLSWQDDVCFKKNLVPNLEFKLELSGSINAGDSLSELNRDDSQLLVICISPGKNDGKSSKKLIDRKGSFKNSSETKVRTDLSLDFDHVSGGYLRKTTNGGNDKENITGKDVVENGFITTKNKSIRTKENSQRGHGEILLSCSRKLRGGEKDCSVMKRKVLAETTNINVEQQCEAKAMEITGKWRCPQKSKPPRVPPLKQLRLERWVHRV